MTRAGWLATASRYGVFLLVGCAAALVSCRKNAVGKPDGTAVDSGASPGDAIASASVETKKLMVATTRACRVMALGGVARARQRFSEPSDAAADVVGPRLLVRGDLIPEGSVIELDAGSELTAHSTVSTREITLLGPAIAELCPGGDEALRLSYGKVTAFPGSGVRPGADVWVATPLGVVRFNDAKIEIVVPDSDAARLETTVITGQATFMPAPGIVAAVKAVGARVDGAAGHALDGDKNIGPARGWASDERIPFAQGATLAARRRDGPASRWALDLVTACLRQATAARQAAERMNEPGDAGPASRADLAVAHVNARQEARAACDAAWAAGTIVPGVFDATRRSELNRADATWKGAPAPPEAYQLTPLPARR